MRPSDFVIMDIPSRSERLSIRSRASWSFALRPSQSPRQGCLEDSRTHDKREVPSIRDLPRRQLARKGMPRLLSGFIFTGHPTGASAFARGGEISSPPISRRRKESIRNHVSPGTVRSESTPTFEALFPSRKREALAEKPDGQSAKRKARARPISGGGKGITMAFQDIYFSQLLPATFTPTLGDRP